MSSALAAEKFWINKSIFDKAECNYYESLSTQKDKSVCNKTNIIKENKTAFDMQTVENISMNDCNTLLKSKKNKSKNKKLQRKNEKKNLSKEEQTNKEFQEDLLIQACSKSDLYVDKRNETVVDSNSNISSFDILTLKSQGFSTNTQCTLVSEIAKAREHIKNSLEKMDGIATLAASPVSSEILNRLTIVEKEKNDLLVITNILKSNVLDLQNRLNILETKLQISTPAVVDGKTIATTKKNSNDDDDVDLFGSDSEEENEEASRIREERLAAYAAKKSKKPVLIAKSSVVLDVKPWDDETNLQDMEKHIRKIAVEGLLWGASKLVPVAFGIKKLSISCVVEDEKVSIDWLTEEIEKLEDFVQSVDVAAFNKI